MIELRQFRISPYNEKIRWILDFKGIPHRRVDLLPGPHAVWALLHTGHTTTPMLRMDGAWIRNSADILARVEERFPEPPLYPADAEERARALEIQRRFDDEWGPRMRRAIFGRALQHPSWGAETFGGGQGPRVKALYVAAFPMLRGVVAKANGVTPESAVDGERAIGEALEWVAGSLRGGYLVGERFTLADLCAASFVAMVVDPPDSTMTRPKPAPEPLEELMAQWAAHPAVAWMQDIYRRHRGVSAVVA